MAYSDLIIDGETEQVFIMRSLNDSNGLWMLSTLNGDFTDNPIHINRPFMTTEDFEVGLTPSSTLSFELLNRDLRFRAFPFGEVQAYIGVLYDVSTYADAGEQADIANNNYHLYLHDDFHASGELTINDVAVQNTKGTSLALCNCTLDPTDDSKAYVYCVDYYGKLLRIDPSDPTNPDDLGTAPAYLADLETQAQTNGSKVVSLEFGNIVESGNYEYTIFEDGKCTIYDCAPVGIYDCVKPMNTSTRTLEITDAYDRIKKFDVSCGTFVSDAWALYESSNYICSAKQYIDLLVSHTGISITAPLYPVPANVDVPLSMLSASLYTYRDLLGYVAGVLGCNAICDMEGNVILRQLPSQIPASYDYTIPLSQIVADSFEMADYSIDPVDYVELYQVNGAYQKFAVLGTNANNNYVFVGNPLLTPDSLQDADMLDLIDHFAYYHSGDQPITISLTELDPMMLDKPRDISVQNFLDTAVYKNLFIWEADLYFCGKTYGTVRSGGNQRRKNVTQDEIVSANAHSSGTQVNTAVRDNFVYLASSTATTPTEYLMAEDAFAGHSYSGFCLICRNNIRSLASLTFPAGLVYDPVTTHYTDDTNFYDYAMRAFYDANANVACKINLNTWHCKLVTSPYYVAELYGIR